MTTPTPDRDQLDRYQAVALQAVSIGAHTLTAARGSGDITDKTDRDIVTETDLRVQQTIMRHLSAATPDATFLGEEQTGHSAGHSLTQVTPDQFADAELAWVLDPIDGTSNYAHGIPLYAVSLALACFGEPIVAVTTIPVLKTTYHAIRGDGAFCNNQPIRVRNTTDLRHAIISISDYATGPDAETKNRRRLSITTALIPAVERIRMFGAATIDLAFVAAGLTDATILDTNKPWDTAAGVLLTREAGATVTDLSGHPHTATGTSTLATTPAIAAQLTPLTAQPH